MRAFEILATVALGAAPFALYAALPAPVRAPIELRDARAIDCEVYELVEGADRDAISDMLQDAAIRVQRTGCVRVVFVRGEA